MQKKIYQDLAGTEESNQKIWEDFQEKVGWKKGEKSLQTSELAFGKDYTGHLPSGSGAWSRDKFEVGRELLSLIETCGL